MALAPGDVLITSFLTDAGAGGVDESFSIVVTKSISVGETIRVWDADGSPQFFEYTVGAGGLSPLDRVTFTEDGSTIAVISDPSGGSITTQPGGTWTNGKFEALVITSEQAGAHDVIAGIGLSTTWDENFTELQTAGVTRIQIDSFTGSPSPVLSNFLNFDNIMFSGTDLAGYDNSSNWTGTDGPFGTHADPNISGTTYASQDSDIFCFAAGTQILTAAGERPVEDLQIGEGVVTSDGHIVPIRWIGRQTVERRFSRERAQMVRIAAGALGDGVPHSDLTVTADHGLVVDGLLIVASALINGSTVAWVPFADVPERFTVYHVETEAHEVILANGLPSETFIDYRGRRRFDNFDEYAALIGNEHIISEMPLPRISASRLVPRHVLARLRQNAKLTA